MRNNHCGGRSVKFMLVGYGTGSKDGDGTAKQYKTLRGDLKTERGEVSFEPRGVKIGNTRVPCLRLKGSTRKVSKDSTNNSAEILLHSITEDEAVHLASTFAEYAIFLKKLRDQPEMTLAFEESSERFARTSVDLLKAAPRVVGITALLIAIRDFWAAKAKTEDVMANVLEMNAKRLPSEQLERQAVAVRRFQNSASWRRESVTQLGQVINTYAHGDSDNSTPAKLGIVSSTGKT